VAAISNRRSKVRAPAMVKPLRNKRHREFHYRGAVREAITKRIVATLKGDPDLVRLEQEAEERERLGAFQIS
jgi:hypothetical protein